MQKSAKTYNEFNPIKLINNWNTPILIIQGGKITVCQLDKDKKLSSGTIKIKSKFLLFPDENHWVLKPQNALVWQRNFWLVKETL